MPARTVLLACGGAPGPGPSRGRRRSGGRSATTVVDDRPLRPRTAGCGGRGEGREAGGDLAQRQAALAADRRGLLESVQSVRRVRGDAGPAALGWTVAVPRPAGG